MWSSDAERAQQEFLTAPEWKFGIVSFLFSVHAFLYFGTFFIGRMYVPTNTRVAGARGVFHVGSCDVAE